MANKVPIKENKAGKSDDVTAQYQYVGVAPQS